VLRATLSCFQHAFSIVPQIAVRINVSVEHDGSDFLFFAEFGDRCVAIGRGGLGEADLGLGEREFLMEGLASEAVVPKTVMIDTTYLKTLRAKTSGAV